MRVPEKWGNFYFVNVWLAVHELKWELVFNPRWIISTIFIYLFIYVYIFFLSFIFSATSSLHATLKTKLLLIGGLQAVLFLGCGALLQDSQCSEDAEVKTLMVVVDIVVVLTLQWAAKRSRASAAPLQPGTCSSNMSKMQLNQRSCQLRKHCEDPMGPLRPNIIMA